MLELNWLWGLSAWPWVRALRKGRWGLGRGLQVPLKQEATPWPHSSLHTLLPSPQYQDDLGWKGPSSPSNPNNSHGLVVPPTLASAAPEWSTNSLTTL